jgi:DNA-binding response OmpR family regulator
MQLRSDGYEVALATSAEHALVLVRTRSPCVVLVGALPRPGAALDIVAELRSERAPARPHSPLGVIVLGSTAHPLDAMRALERGADDYVRPSIAYLELRARIAALARRAEPNASPLVCVGSLTIDTHAHTVEIDGTPVALRRLEFELLVYLARDPERVFAKHELLAAVWGYRSPAKTRTLDSHVSRLRCKLREAGAQQSVVNVWGVGYRLT